MVETLSLWLEWFEKDGNPIYEDSTGDLACFFCGEYQVHCDSDNHDDNCIYVRAKALMVK